MGNMNTNKLVISVYIAVLPAMAIVHIVLLKSISMNRAMVNVCIVVLLAMAIVRTAPLANTNINSLSPKVCPKNSRAYLFTQKNFYLITIKIIWRLQISMTPISLIFFKSC